MNESRASAIAAKNDPEGIFIDAGANIGACTLLMAAAGHRTIGFEPSAANFFYLSSGVLANTEEIRQKVKLYQMALGQETGIVDAYVAQGNGVIDIILMMKGMREIQYWRQ